MENGNSTKNYNVEVFLPDYKENQKKWSNNIAWRNDNQVYSSTLDAFSHWTYDITDGFLMIADFQGLERNSHYILSDSAIYCKEETSGLTTLGGVGIMQFFKSHRCGQVCRDMGLDIIMSA